MDGTHCLGQAPPAPPSARCRSSPSTPAAIARWRGSRSPLSYELRPFGIAARLVEPGYAPTTNFTANGGPRMEGLIPADYGPFAAACFAKVADYPTAYCTEQEVAEATFAAATDEERAIHYPAGADTRMLAGLRWSTSEDHYLCRMREMFEPGL